MNFCEYHSTERCSSILYNFFFFFFLICFWLHKQQYIFGCVICHPNLLMVITVFLVCVFFQIYIQSVTGIYQAIHIDPLTVCNVIIFGDLIKIRQQLI